ncbi:MAG TPA: SIMPL domain-containing protein [Chitinophagales bacterium]|nr:SIMPL domain-containing protein [Chitinophagales bacterium]HRK25843.1 SIMPL domain-containing protein [Chitinophagales bacterium]
MVYGKRLYLWFIFYLLVWQAPLLAQVSGNANYAQQQQSAYNNRMNYNADNLLKSAVFFNDNTILLETNALLNLKADAYLAIFNLSQLGETASQADELMNKRIENITKETLALGIPAADIYTDMLSLVPVYEIEVEKKLFSKTYNEVPKGFEMQKNLHIKYTNSAVLDKIITIAAKYETYDLVKVEYYIEKPDAAYKTLREATNTLLAERLTELKKLGLNLDAEYHIIAEDAATYYPPAQYSSYQAFSSNSFDAIKKKSGIIQTQKPVSVYYAPLPNTHFDIVINPVIVEPVVQFTYNLKVKYLLKKPPVKELWLITPTGDMKNIKTE